MRIQIIVNDAPYGIERCYNAMRLADVLLKIEEEVQLTLCLLGDAVLCAKAGQQTPTGFYNVERMLAPILRRGLILVCETCMAARGLTQNDLVKGCRQAKLGEVGMATLEADKVLTF